MPIHWGKKSCNFLTFIYVLTLKRYQESCSAYEANHEIVHTDVKRNPRNETDPRPRRINPRRLELQSACLLKTKPLKKSMYFYSHLLRTVGMRSIMYGVNTQMNKCSEKKMNSRNLTFFIRQNFFFLPNFALDVKRINSFANLTVDKKTKQDLSGLPLIFLTQIHRC